MIEIKDIFESDIELSEAKDKKLFLANLTVPLAKGDVENGNKRTYSSALLKREMGKMNIKLKLGPVPGMLRHNPDGVIALDKVSHVFTEFFFNDKDKTAYGKARILNTTKGKDLHTLIQSGVKCGASTVGHGTVNAGGVVETDYDMRTADIVHTPSSKMFIGPAMLESLNSALESGNEGLKKKDPKVNILLLQEQRAAGYYKLEKEKKTIEAVKDGLTFEERKIAGGKRIIE